MKPRAEHYIMTVPVGPVRMHLYLMTEQRRFIKQASNQLLDEAEKLGRECGVMVLPVVLMTGPLDQKTARQVRAALCEADPSVKTTMQAATDIHCTMFVAGPELDKLFMELH